MEKAREMSIMRALIDKTSGNYIQIVHYRGFNGQKGREKQAKCPL
ncbi:hypothetical protein SAMN05877842_10978 [Ureibacillus acetophenoni]|uniref:Uncharacterized protein n=1 Tax=Ureibacillus acetophenoni TaxID=614649 RepID=A0A285UI27_9BACL|nr:hypothetical protein SAMN05877842_10978 [Ureibacillus acetophenoni]